MIEPSNHVWFKERSTMSSITLHNLPSSLYGLLKQKAQNEGKSLNRTIQDLLSESLGLGGKPARRGKKDVYDEMCGAMPMEERTRMEESEKEFEATHDEDWL